MRKLFHRKIISLLLVAVILLGMPPAELMTVFAAAPENGYELTIATDNEAKFGSPAFAAVPVGCAPTSGTGTVTFTPATSYPVIGLVGNIPNELLAVKVTIDDESRTQLLSAVGYASSATNGMQARANTNNGTATRFASDSSSPFYYIAALFGGATKQNLYITLPGAVSTDNKLAGKTITITYLFNTGEQAGEQYNVTVADSAYGSAACVKNELENNSFFLTATPNALYMLDRWEKKATGADDSTYVIDEDATAQGATATVTVTEDTTYRAVFKGVQFAPDGIIVSVGYSSTEGGWSGAPLQASKLVYPGQYVELILNCFVPSAVPEGTQSSFAVYAGSAAEGAPLTQFSETRSFTAGNVRLGFKPNFILPSGVTELTVWAQLGAEGTPSTKTFDIGAYVKTTGAALGETQVSAEPSGTYGIGIYPAFSALSFTDGVTGQLSMYVATGTRIYEYSAADGLKSMITPITSASQNLINMQKGWPGYVWNIHSIGGTEKKMTAFARDTGDVIGALEPVTDLAYYLWEYTPESGQWAEVPGSRRDNERTDAGLVVSNDEVWSSNTVWKGTAWTDHGYAFNSFYSGGSGVHFAGSASGLYRYADGGWTEVGDFSNVQVIAASSDGRAVIKTGSVYHLVQADGSAAALDVSQLPFAGDGASGILGFGFDYEGSLYCFSGRMRSNDRMAASYAYEYIESENEWHWRPMSGENGQAGMWDLISDVMVPGGTQWSSATDRTFNPAPGVTLFAGHDYLSFNLLSENRTVTFDSYGGSAVEPVTGRIGLDTVSAPNPSPTKEGCSFGGWWYSVNERATFPLTIPAKNITLTAKWNPEGAGDELAEEKEDALKALEKIYRSYDRDDYTADEWAQLTAAYNGGKTAINDATDYDGIQNAMIVAGAAMSAVNATYATYARAVVCIEKLTVDGTLIVEPVLVETQKGTLVSQITLGVLQDAYPDAPQVWRTTGTPHTGGMYISHIYDPTYVPGGTALFSGNLLTQGYPGFLGETDAGRWSGWMYSVSNEFLGVSCGAAPVRNGDVIRWQYTSEGIGADIGAGEFSEGPPVVVANKDKLITAIAIVNSLGTKDDYGQDYTHAMDVLKTLYATQDEVNAALLPFAGIVTVDDHNTVMALIDAIGTPVTFDKKAAVSEARKAYDGLGSAEKALVENYDVLLAAEEALKPFEVADSIEKLPEVNKLVYSDSPAVEAVKDAFDALTAEQRILIAESLRTKLADAVARIAVLRNAITEQLDNMYTSTAAYTVSLGIPGFGSEWVVLGLARSGYNVPDGYFDAYAGDVVRELQENGGDLLGGSAAKYTEYERVILALTAIGMDVRNVGGYDLLSYLSDFDKTSLQGVNSVAFALIAFDAYNYEIPVVASGGNQLTREKLINKLLDYELDEGGWDYSNQSIDPDMTGMVIQALAPYYNSNARVKAAVDRGLDALSLIQKSDGGFVSWGTANSESTAQVIVALTALGIDPMTDARFTKNGANPITALLSFYVEGGGFKHIASQDSPDGMATEQAYYALAAYYRFKESKTRLYDMSDVTLKEAYVAVISLIDSIGEVTLESESMIKTARALYASLNEEQKAKVPQDKLDILVAAEAKLARLKADKKEAGAVDDLIRAIGTVTLKSEQAITSARKAYDALTSAQKKLVTKLSFLIAAEARLAQLKAGGGAPATGQPGQSGITPSGQPGRSVTVTVEGVEYTVDEEIAAVMEDIAALMETLPASGAAPDDAAAIFALYEAYQALSEEQRPFVANYSDLETAMENIRAAIQSDGATGVNVTGLPWHVGLKVERLEDNGGLWSELQERAGEEETLLALFEISLIDYVTGVVYEAGGEVTVTMPAPDYEGYDGIVILHRKSDGSIEYIQPVINGDGTITFVLRSFSAVGVLGYKGASPVDLIAEKEAAPWWPWLLVALGVAAVIVVLALRRRKGGQVGV